MFQSLANAPPRAIAAVEATIFRADGTRSVIGTLGCVTYDSDGNASVTFTVPAPRSRDTLRFDLGVDDGE